MQSITNPIQQKYEQLLQKIHLQLEYPFKMNEQNEKVLIVRHGFSEFNFYDHQYRIDENWYTDLPPDSYKQLRLNRSLIDAKLHEIGEEQAILAQKNINQLNFATVFVSPFRRTLQTCHLLFQNHPNKNKINFIVSPWVCENLMNGCDIPLDIKQIRQEYENQGYDFSEFDKIENPKLWQLHVFQDQIVKEKILSKIQDKNSAEQMQNAIFDYYEEIFPLPAERKISAFRRANKFKEILKDHIAKLNYNDEKICIVSHFGFLEALTATGVDEANNKAIGSIIMRNCEIIPFQIS